MTSYAIVDNLHWFRKHHIEVSQCLNSFEDFSNGDVFFLIYPTTENKKLKTSNG